MLFLNFFARICIKFTNKVLHFCYSLTGLIHKIDLAKEDKIPERLVKASMLMESVVTFAAAPAYFSLIYFKVHVFALFNFESVLVTFILSLIGSFGIMIDFLSMNLYALNVFAYCAAVLRSLKASR